MNLRTRTFAALAGAAIIFGACQAATPSGGAAAGGLDGALVKRSDIKIEIVTHGQAQDGVAALRVAEAADRSLHEHRPVRLEEIPG